MSDGLGGGAVGRKKKVGAPDKERDKEKRTNLYDENTWLSDYCYPPGRLSDAAVYAELAEFIEPHKEILEDLGLRGDFIARVKQAYILAKNYSERMASRKELKDIWGQIEEIPKKAEELSELLAKCSKRSVFFMTTRSCWNRIGEEKPLGAKVEFDKLIGSLKSVSECLNREMERLAELDYSSIGKFVNPEINLFVQEILIGYWYSCDNWPEMPNSNRAGEKGIEDYPFVLFIRSMLFKFDGNPRDEVEEEATLVSLINREITALEDSGRFS